MLSKQYFLYLSNQKFITFVIQSVRNPAVIARKKAHREKNSLPALAEDLNSVTDTPLDNSKISVTNYSSRISDNLSGLNSNLPTSGKFTQTYKNTA